MSQACKGATVAKFDCTSLHGTMQMVRMTQDTSGVSAASHAQVGCHDDDRKRYWSVLAVHQASNCSKPDNIVFYEVH